MKRKRRENDNLKEEEASLFKDERNMINDLTNSQNSEEE
jgi:hypothetical protein